MGEVQARKMANKISRWSKDGKRMDDEMMKGEVNR